MTEQAIYKTPNGCYRVGKRYFRELDGALHAVTREECAGDTILADEDVVHDVMRELQIRGIRDRAAKQVR